MPATSRDHEPLLRFWFGPPPADPATIAGRQPMWWSSDPELDRRLRDDFGELWAAAVRGELDAWVEEPRSALALVLLLDQLSRNLERGSAAAFAHDRRARELAAQAIARGHDRLLSPPERQFLYLPFEHSEDPADQRRAIELFGALDASAAPEWKELTADALRWAQVHAEIIERFGRFPHRNRVLDREPTAEEERYLAEGGHSFGQ